MKTISINENSVKVLCDNGDITLVAKHKDAGGIYFLNEKLQKQYVGEKMFDLLGQYDLSSIADRFRKHYSEKYLPASKITKKTEIMDMLNNGFPSWIQIATGRAYCRIDGRKIPKGSIDIIVLMGESSYMLKEFHIDLSKLLELYK